MSGRTICICGGTFTMCEDGHAIDCPASNQFDRYKAMMGGPAACLTTPQGIMSGAVEGLRHLELMALNTAQTAAAATKVNECVALLSASRTTPPARSYADEDVAERADLIATLSDFADGIDRFGFVNALGGHATTLRAAIRLLSQGEEA